MATYQLYNACRILNEEIQSSVGFVEFNHQLCEHLAARYSDAFEDPDAGYGSDCSAWVSGCEPALKELQRLMLDGRSLVEACKKKDWWKRAIIYSDDAAFDERVYFYLLQFLGCVDSLRAALAEATTNQFSSAKPNLILEDIDAAELHAEITEIGKEDKNFLEIEMEKMLWDPLAAFLHAKLTNPLQPVEMKKIEIEWPACSEKDLGKGAYGKVQQCLWHGEVVAVKSMIDVQDRSTLRKEAAVWQGLSHPHLVNMVGCNGLQEDSDFIVMELMGKELGKWVKEHSEPPIWLIVLDIILQIAQGIRYLHSPKKHHRHMVDKVIHRDLKPENFLLTRATRSECAESAGHVKVKVADFGLSKTKELISRFKSKAVGTPRYTAMEILRLRLRKGNGDSLSKDAESESYTWSSDVWSFAMSVSEILTGEQPFGEQVGTSATFLSKLEQGWRPALPSSIPPYFAELISKCWDETPSERPSFIDICDMLLFCKNTSLRGSMPSKVASINEYNARKFIRHLGGEWCLHEGCLRHELISLDTYYEVLSESEKHECCRTLVDLGKGYGDWTCSTLNLDQVKRAVKLFQFAANKFNDPEAMWRLGLSFEFGLGTEVNMAKAIANYEIASKLGFAPANVELGLCYSVGRGYLADLDVAADHWKNALRGREEAHAGEGVEVDSIRELIQHTISWSEAEGRRKKEDGKKEDGMRSLQRLIEITSQLSEGRRLVAGHNCGNISDLVKAAQKSNCSEMRNLLKNLSKDKEINKSILSFKPRVGLWLKWLCAVLFLWAVYSLCTWFWSQATLHERYDQFNLHTKM